MLQAFSKRPGRSPGAPTARSAAAGVGQPTLVSWHGRAYRPLLPSARILIKMLPIVVTSWRVDR